MQFFCVHICMYVHTYTCYTFAGLYWSDGQVCQILVRRFGAPIVVFLDSFANTYSGSVTTGAGFVGSIGRPEDLK